MKNLYEYVGAIHMHSVFSDGSAEANEIALIANEVGLDFISLTDHNTLRALKEGFEKFYGNTFLMVGCEINDKENKNHYLAFGIDEVFSTRLPAKEYVKRIKENGGIGFLAHPLEKRSSMKEHPPYPWIEWDTNDFTGIEIWNHMSEWMENLTEQNKYQSFMHPLRTIISPTKEIFELWDRLSLERKVVGIGGVDAHAHKINLLGFFEVEVFPYKVLFKSIRTHILSTEKIVINSSAETITKTKQIILNALKEGKCFVSNFYQGDAKGFKFEICCNDKVFTMGDKVKLSNDLFLNVVVPEKIATIKIIHNGKEIFSVKDSSAELKVSSEGIYRAEVWNESKGWIFSNHIRVELN